MMRGYWKEKATQGETSPSSNDRLTLRSHGQTMGERKGRIPSEDIDFIFLFWKNKVYKKEKQL